MAWRHFQRATFIAFSMLLAGNVCAQGISSLDLQLTRHDIKIRKDEHGLLKQASFNSGLGLKFHGNLFQFALNYKAQVMTRGKAGGAEFSQRLNSSIHSTALNRALGMNAKIHAGSTIRQGGDAYDYSITPGLSKSIRKLARLDVQYQYLLSKKTPQASEREKLGFRMGLSGKAQQGRLSWKGNYRLTDEFGRNRPLLNTELLEFESRFQLAPELNLVLSGHSKDETRYLADYQQDVTSEIRYAAGLDWSPSHYYSMALKLNKRSESTGGEDEVFGSGSFSWFPWSDVEFRLSYGDHLIKGSRGMMLNTRIDLGSS